MTLTHTYARIMNETHRPPPSRLVPSPDGVAPPASSASASADGTPGDSAAPGTPDTAAVSTGIPVFSSQDLLQGRREVLIEHLGEMYRLRLTRNGRLVLYK